MKLYLASGNAHKVAEMNALAQASGLAVEIISARAVGGMPPVVEDAGTFIGNARKKARALQALLPVGAWVLADDSGLCVDALAGAPGVESAYYAGAQSDPVANLHKLADVMKDVPPGKRQAHFICVLVVLGPDGVEQVFPGRCDGDLAVKPSSESGFGYDPLFIPSGHSRTFEELDMSIKNALSHRALAWTALTEWMRSCGANLQN